MSTGDQSETELGASAPHQSVTYRSTVPAFLVLPVTCIPFINTLLEMLKQRPEGLSQGLPSMSGKAVEDPLALCFPQRPCSQSPWGWAGWPCSWQGTALHTPATARALPSDCTGSAPPAPGSGHRALKHHCTAQLGASHPAQAGVSQHLRSCLTSLGLQYSGK